MDSAVKTARYVGLRYPAAFTVTSVCGSVKLQEGGGVTR